jgi:hypothetical protein
MGARETITPTKKIAPLVGLTGGDFLLTMPSLSNFRSSNQAFPLNSEFTRF